MASFGYQVNLDVKMGLAFKALDVLDKMEESVVRIAGRKIDFSQTLRGVRELEAFNNVLQQSTDALLGVINKSASMSDVMAVTQKNTGLTTTEMQALKSTIDKIDTRTATQDLLKMATVGGKMGIAKNELAGFVKVVDKATVALGDEFGGSAEKVATVLGKIRGQYKEFENTSAENALSSIGSAINFLGKSGANSAPNVAEFTQRVSTLGLSLAQASGMGATLEELGLSAEISSGGLINIMSLASTESAKFAKHLGINQKAFEDLVNSNPNQVIVDLARSFKGASQTQIAQRLKDLGIGSQESMRVMQLLSSNTDLLTERQMQAAHQVSKKTDLDNEAAIMQNTLAGQMDRVKKVFDSYAVSIGQFLAPYSGLIQTTAFVSLGLSSLIPLFSGLGNLLLSGTTLLFRYALGLTVVSGRLAFTKASLLGVILQTGRWATMLLVQGVRSLALFAGRLVMMSAVALPALIASLGGASLATAIFNAVMSINPFVAIMIGITALIAGFALLINRFGSAGNAVRALWNFVLEYNPTSLLIKGFDKLFGTNMFGRVKGFFKTIGDWVGKLWGKISSFWDWMSGKETQKASKEPRTKAPSSKAAQKAVKESKRLEKEIKAALKLEGKRDIKTFDLNQRLDGGAASQGLSRANTALNQVTGGGSRSTNINIDIGKLVETFTVNTSQGIAATDIERKVTEALMRVINGANQVAGA